MRMLWIFGFILLTAIGAHADIVSLIESDKRLEKKVSIEADHAKLEDVAKTLTEQTGVTIKAGSSKRDWKVSEQHVTICAKDVPLGTLLDQLSELLSFRLSKEGEGSEASYLLWQDLKSRTLEAEMLTAEKEADAQRSTKLRQAGFDMAEDALKMTPEEALKQKDKNPLLAYMGGTKEGRGYAQLLSGLGAIFPTERDLMLRGKSVTIAFSSLPPAMQQAAMDTMGGKMSSLLGGSGDWKSYTPYQFVILPASIIEEGAMGALGMGALMFVTGQKPGMEPNYDGYDPFNGANPLSAFAFGSPDSPAGKAFGKFFMDIGTGVDPRKANDELGSKLDNPEAVMSALAHDSPTEKKPPTDPELTREVDLKIEANAQNHKGDLTVGNHEISGFVAAISDALERPVLLESFVKMRRMGGFVKPGKQPVYKIMIGLEKAGYTWSLEKGILRIRSGDWALRRSYGIPESTLNYYKDLIDKQGELTLDDMAGMIAELTDEQIDNTLANDPSLSLYANESDEPFDQRRELMRFYNLLSASGKKALKGETGLSFRDLSSKQWDFLNPLISERLGGMYVLDGQIRLFTDPERPSLQSFDITINVANVEKPFPFSQNIYMPDKEAVKSARDSEKALEEVNSDK